jgi:hypothetical protein
MPQPSRVVRALAVTGACVLATGVTVGATTAAGSAPKSSVTVLLKAPDQAGLNRLATASGQSHAQRVAALARLLPTAAAHHLVESALQRQGYTVTGETAWTVTAKATTGKVADDFGTAVADPDSTAVQPMAKPAAPPPIPQSIAPVTAAVLPTQGPALFTAHDVCGGCHNGSDFRDAYTAPRVSPATGADRNATLTIATLQFAGWNDSDLTAYAKSVHLPDPIASNQLVQVPVGEKSVPPASKSEQGVDEEVDLDQETILSTDPSADQRAYFSPNNSMSGYIQDLNQVLADVTQSNHAFEGGDPNIVALSTSWGTCEAEFSRAFNHETITAVENTLKSLTAAGVTVFAASGDDGVYDCGNPAQPTKIAVDYPASSPEVVGVGGTRLRAPGGRAANTGSNWTDTGWSCKSAETCEGSARRDTGGSGGGESTVFRMPAYQSVGIGHQPFTTTTGEKGDYGTQPRRLVPDIADDGDPKSGFDVLTSDPHDIAYCGNPTCNFPIGGTSLSSPEAASLFTNMLARHGVTSGVGDIHPALYSAYAAHNGAFRDVTSGRTGAQPDIDRHARHGTARELPVDAQRGYDTVTGLGAPLWPRLAPYIFTPARPRAGATIRLTHPHSAKASRTLTATWRARPASVGGSAAASARVTVTEIGARKPVLTLRHAAAAGSRTFRARRGGDYQLTVTEHDLAGQSVSTRTRPIAVPLDDRSFTFHGLWTRVAGHADFAGSHALTTMAGAYAKTTARGRRYVLRVRTGPAYGKLAIDHGGATIETVDLYTPRAGHLRVVVFGGPTSPLRPRTFTFRYTGHKNQRSSSAAVDVDALSVYR